MATLVIAEHDNQSLKAATLNTVAAALQCSPEVDILVAGSGTDAVAAAATQIAGVRKVIQIDAASLADQLAEPLAAQILSIANQYSHILAPATANGKNVLPRVAAKLDVAQLSDITKVISADTFERPIYAGNAIATVQTNDSIKVITVRTTGFDPVAATGGSAVIEKQAAVESKASSSFVGPSINKV
jgi:electron transfer flavoprotein alpha subunit